MNRFDHCKTHSNIIITQLHVTKRFPITSKFRYWYLNIIYFDCGHIDNVELKQIHT
jgi:hypothetical protein